MPATATGRVRLSALIDYDFCVRAAPLEALPAMLEMIHDPSSIVDKEHPDFEALSRLDLMWLVPVLREELPELCALDSRRDQRRLNLLYIRERLPYEDNIERLVHEELLDDEHINQTRYAWILRGDRLKEKPVEYRTASPC